MVYVVVALILIYFCYFTRPYITLMHCLDVKPLSLTLYIFIRTFIYTTLISKEK